MTNAAAVTSQDLIERIKSRLDQEKPSSATQRTRLHAQRPQTTGQFFAMPHEDRAAFNLHCAAIIEAFHPETALERWLATAIAEDMWRLDRARAIENNIFSVGISGPIGDTSLADSPEVHAAACHARIWLRDARQLQILALYEQRVRRNLEKNEKYLRSLQSQRRAEYLRALEEAALLAKVAEAEGRLFDPAEDALPGQPVVTPEHLARFVRRDLRLAEGRRLRKAA